jgi:hypothetical protein
MMKTLVFKHEQIRLDMGVLEDEAEHHSMASDWIVTHNILVLGGCNPVILVLCYASLTCESV